MSEPAICRRLQLSAAALAIIFNVAYGVMNARKTRLLAAWLMGARRHQILPTADGASTTAPTRSRPRWRRSAGPSPVALGRPTWRC